MVKDVRGVGSFDFDGESSYGKLSVGPKESVKNLKNVIGFLALLRTRPSEI